jgi:hypothetical protein
VPQVGDKVYPANSPMVYEISHVRVGGDRVDPHVPNTNLQRFCVRTDRLTSAERKPPAQTSKPFTSPELVFAGGESLKSLKKQRVPKATIQALEDLPAAYHRAWKIAIVSSKSWRSSKLSRRREWPVRV